MDPNQPQQPIPAPTIPQPTAWVSRPVAETPPAGPPTQAQPAVPQIPPKKPKSRLSILLILLFVLLIGLGGFFGYQKYLGGKIPPEATPIITAVPSPVIDPTADWKTYSIDKFGIQFKLPPTFIQTGPNPKEIKGDTGTAINSFFAEGGVNVFVIGSTSVDYSAGRGGTFIDLQGYVIEDGKYYTKFVSGKKFDVSNEKITLVKITKDNEALKIIGSNSPSPEGLPTSGTPGVGSIGALINLDNNKKYTGFAIEMKLTGNLTETLFDQILSTFKFTDRKDETVSWKEHKAESLGLSFKAPTEMNVDFTNSVITIQDYPLNAPPPDKFYKALITVSEGKIGTIETTPSTTENKAMTEKILATFVFSE